MPSSRSVHARSLIAGIGALLPPAAVLVLIDRLAVNIPYHDDWDLLPVVTGWHAGTAGLHDFWQQHSEHRVVALKAAIWAIGGLTDFNVVSAMFVGFALAALTFALLADLVRLGLKDHEPRAIAPVLTICSFLVFSLVQHESWFWSTASLQLFLINLCTVAMIWTLARWPNRGRSVALAAGCAIVGMFTEASGQLLWITGAASIALSSAARSDRRRWLSLWAVAACSTVAAYMWELQWASTSVAFAALHPGRLIVFAGACLGLPFASWASPELSALAGWSGCAALSIGCWFVFQHNRPLIHKLLPMLLLAAHAVLVALMIAIGRASGDPQSALTSHYSFAPTLFWVAVVVVTAAAWSHAWSGFTRRTRPIAGVAVVAVFAFLTVGYARVNADGYRQAYTRSRNLQMAAATVSSLNPPPREVLRFLYPPDEDRARRLLADLRAFGLGPFSNGSKPALRDIARQFTPTLNTAGVDGFLDGGDCHGATGWAWDPEHPDLPVTLDVWAGGTRLGTATANWFRGDLLAAGKGNGQHAFRFLFPTQTELQTGRVVNVTFAGSDRALRGSPRIVPCRD